MPIYAYRCATCGHAQDVLQKMSDDVLTVCPACGAATYEKQVTAAGFQLKGSGWYVTDFRGGNTAGPPKDGKDGKDAKEGAAAQPGDKPAEGGDKAAAPTPAGGAPAAPAASTAPAPAPAAAAPPPASST
jgi:putative FmdB family regulatory protein